MLLKAMVQAGLAAWTPLTTSWSVQTRLQLLLISLLLATWRPCRHTLWWLVRRAVVKWSAFCRTSRSVMISFTTFIFSLFVIYIILLSCKSRGKTHTVRLKLKNAPQLKHVFLCLWNIFALSLFFVCFLRLNLVPKKALIHSSCSSLTEQRTSFSKIVPSVCRRFQRQAPLNSSWERSTWLPWPHSESAAKVLQVCSIEGLIIISTYTSLPDTLNNMYFSSHQIWRNPARSIPVNKKFSDGQRARGVSFSLHWFRNLHNTFFSSSETCFMHFFTDLFVDLINMLEPFWKITLCVFYICMPEFSPNKNGF